MDEFGSHTQSSQSGQTGFGDQVSGASAEGRPPSQTEKAARGFQELDGGQQSSNVGGHPESSVTRDQQSGNFTRAPPPVAAQISRPTVITLFFEDLPAYVQRYDSLEAGAHAFYAPIRTLNLQNDDHEQISANPEFHVNAVYTAITASPENPIYAQERMVADFEQTIASIANPEILLTDIAYLIVKCLLELHVQGDNLRPDQIRELQPTDNDKSLKASQRLNYIVAILKNTKTIVKELLTGRDSVTAFVASPQSSHRRELRRFARQLARQAEESEEDHEESGTVDVESESEIE